MVRANGPLNLQSKLPYSASSAQMLDAVGVGASYICVKATTIIFSTSIDKVGKPMELLVVAVFTAGFGI